MSSFNFSATTTQVSIYNYLNNSTPTVAATLPEAVVVPVSGSSSSLSSIVTGAEGKEEKIEEEEKEEEEEIWQPIKKHPAFKVSNLGNLRDEFGNKMKQYFSKSKGDVYYYGIRIHGRHYRVHVLVAREFIPNPLNLPEVDHIDLNTKNNKWNNLRWATRSQQGLNRNKRRDKQYTSKYKGVSLHACGKWIANASVNGKHKFLGLFSHEVLAAEAYNDWYKKHEPEFAILNDIENDEEYIRLKETRSNKWRKRIPGANRYYGVARRGKRFYVSLWTKGGKTLSLGSFAREKTAARKYNEKRIELLGENCNRLNVISSDESDNEEEVQPTRKRRRVEEADDERTESEKEN